MLDLRGILHHDASVLGIGLAPVLAALGCRLECGVSFAPLQGFHFLFVHLRGSEARFEARNDCARRERPRSSPCETKFTRDSSCAVARPAMQSD